MAHFAQLNENNIVINVLVVSNDDIQNLSFPQSESVGITFLQKMFPNTTWKQTSYNNNFRFRYAGIGFTFHTECGEHGGFSLQKPVSNFVLDTTNCTWIPPIPYPTDGFRYVWNFETSSWDKVSSIQTTIIG